MSNKIKPEDIDNITQMYLDKIPLAEIGRLYSVSANSIKFYLQKVGVYEVGWYKRPKDEIEEIRSLYKKNVPLTKIADKFKISHSYISEFIKTIGVKPKGPTRTRILNRLNLTELDIVEKYKKEKDVRKIATEIGTSDTTIRTILKKAGLKNIGVQKHKVNHFVSSKKQIYKEYYEKFHSLEEIANKYNIGITSVCNWMNKWGWERRHRFENTFIERFIASFLKDKGVKFEKQFEIKPFKYDFYLPDYNLLLEVNGDYWHGNTYIYKESDLSKVQKKNISRDSIKFLKSQKRDYKILYIWESEIKKSPIEVKEVLYKNIKSGHRHENHREFLLS